MEKIKIKELVEFRQKTDRPKKNYANKLKTRPIKPKIETEGGGDYWVTSTSCIYNVFKYDKDELYDEKIDELQIKFESTEDTRIKSMYERNIDILTSFKDFELNYLKPSGDLKYVSVPKDSNILTISNFPLYVRPSLLFSFDKNGKKEMGALWLVPQLNGFKKVELGMFCEILYRFLIKNYSADYQISQDHCIAIDTYSAQKVIYSELQNGNLPFLIDKTISEIKAL